MRHTRRKSLFLIVILWPRGRTSFDYQELAMTACFNSGVHDNMHVQFTNRWWMQLFELCHDCTCFFFVYIYIVGQWLCVTFKRVSDPFSRDLDFWFWDNIPSRSLPSKVKHRSAHRRVGFLSIPFQSYTCYFFPLFDLKSLSLFCLLASVSLTFLNFPYVNSGISS